jgi:osmotically inducible protein OsmC
MKSIKRNASVRWKSGPDSRHQQIKMEKFITMAKGALQIPYHSESEVSPAALFAAAHASSFSLALSSQLQQVKMDSGTFLTTAVVTVNDSPAGWTVSNIHLTVLANLPNISQCEFIDATVRAKTSCTISRLVQANISMNAKLEK